MVDTSARGGPPGYPAKDATDRADAALIAAMRNALPRLLLERKELLAALEKLAAQHCDEPGCAHRACAMSAYAAAAAYHNAFAEEKG